ncbi:uncharacterized protein N0V89_009395 [Didymosphaeria variabile]|uniref:Uncharacterized protein n=1 Tax=Didymosphaeria variabile TaxID=1932322 RepID=A0A9W8XFG3_9PLEO|nr:uncharacterized protein N0V89_009395 [Didymosphaeria variabile]KAJ4348023.1 hypothetical protein N0V89_009395 [Didymosphaeria variabile]
MDINSNMTFNEPSEMMDIEQPSMGIHDADDAQKTTQEVAFDMIDSVMGTPAPDGTTDKYSTPHVLLTRPVSDETPKSIPAQGLDSTHAEYPEVTDIPSIQELFASYATSFPAPSKIGNKGFDYVKYFDPARMTKVRAKHQPRLDIAKELAATLLEHYYPEEQGYRVEPVQLPLSQFGGWRTWIYPEDCYAATKRKADNLKAGLKKNPKPVYETWGGNIQADKFHRILPEHIAGYVVLSEVQFEDGSTGWAQHTYLAIMMDDLDTFEHWVPEKLMRPEKNFVSMPRADVLSDSMGRQAEISHGYAILMLGPRFEFYNYQAKPAWEEKPWEHYLGPDPENDPDHDPDSAAEDQTSCFSHFDGRDVDNDSWVVDIRSKPPTETVAAVDRLFKSVVGRDVEYRDGYSLPGPKI